MTVKPLKILQVASGFPGWGGTELHLLNLSEQLIARGHNVTVTARPGKFVAAEAEKRGLPLVPITVKRQWDFGEADAIKKLLATEHYDVVHVHWSTDYVVTPYLARRAGVPAVFMSRHSPYKLKSILGRILYDRLLFDRIIALSESVRRTLTGPGQSLRPDRVITIHHGTDTEAFRKTTRPPQEIRAEWKIPPDAFLVGMVGRIAEEKGWRTFVDALTQSKIPNLHGVFIGSGVEEVDAREKVKSLDITDRVTFAGFQSDVNNAINALDVLVLASTWEEPCAAVVQQAMALSKPVIGTNLGGTPEMIAENKTGLLVPPGDAPALTNALATLAPNPTLRTMMGNAGRQRADDLFTLSRMTDTIEKLYQDIVTSKRSNAA